MTSEIVSRQKPLPPDMQAAIDTARASVTDANVPALLRIIDYLRYSREVVTEEADTARAVAALNAADYYGLAEARTLRGTIKKLDSEKDYGIIKAPSGEEFWFRLRSKARPSWALHAAVEFEPITVAGEQRRTATKVRAL